ncbi:MAG: ribonuclease III [Dehalococcoidia bacterium]
MPLAVPPALQELVGSLGVGSLSDQTLEEALTHASYLNESDAEAISNERLEFLGDAVLGMVVANELFRRYPNVGEGDLTRMRADVVRGSTLALVAQRLGLGSHLILGRGEESAGGRERERNLAGGLEALIGAVYRERGYRAAGAFVLRLLAPELELLKKGGAQIDAKSRLQHVVQARWHEPPQYVTVNEEPSGTGKTFTVEVTVDGAPVGRGAGGSKREAQQRAAETALAWLAGQVRSGD